MKGQVAKCDHREYGFASVEVVHVGSANGSVDALFQGLGESMDVRQFVYPSSLSVDDTFN
jgi:GMP synthase (glutamine-hydrolysing)